MLLNLLYVFAMAQPPAEGGEGGGGMGLIGFLPWIAIIAIIYFLMIRPQAKRQKEQQNMLKALQKRDKIVTAGGIHGEIVGFKGENQNVMILKIADNTKIEIERSSVGRLVSRRGGDVVET